MSETRERREFCPECGDAVPPREEPLPGAPRDRDRLLCDDCYFETFDLVDAPDRVQVRVCARCGAVHRGNRWVDVGARDYTDVAVEEVTQSLGVHLDAREVTWGVEPEQVDETTIRMHCQFTGIVRESAVEAETTVPVKIARQTCERCGRIAGGSYAATVQVRAVDRRPSSDERDRAVEIVREVVAEREDAGDREAFLTEVDRTDDGPNVKLSTTKLGGRVADRIVRELGGSVSESATLVTEDSDGNEVYRVTYSVRLPRFRPGDVIDPEPAGLTAVEGSGPVVVETVGGAITGVRLRSGRQFQTDADLSDAEQLGHVDDGDPVTLVAVEDENAVQVLDPETFEAVSVPNPDFFDADGATEGETVPAVKFDGEVFLVPELIVDNG
ncbi:60S ribosomal export protein NMD3 [Halobaculum sp. MBLA0143]|uniref:60S ribosomal export protein NMD3 n=1 Tax=Halobaculum sp. MBLA0143 TaxID=3079933 RepID=UPI0035232DC6